MPLNEFRTKKKKLMISFIHAIQHGFVMDLWSTYHNTCPHLITIEVTISIGSGNTF